MSHAREELSDRVRARCYLCINMYRERHNTTHNTSQGKAHILHNPVFCESGRTIGRVFSYEHKHYPLLLLLGSKKHKPRPSYRAPPPPPQPNWMAIPHALARVCLLLMCLAHVRLLHRTRTRTQARSSFTRSLSTSCHTHPSARESIDVCESVRCGGE